MTETKTKKPRGIAFTHIALAFLGAASPEEGVTEVQKLYDTGNVSRDTLRAAIKDIKDRKRDVAKLEEWYHDTLGSVAGSPQVGETRRFKVQLQKGTKTPFIKMPVVGVEPGGYVETVYGADNAFSGGPAAVAAAPAKTDAAA